MAKRSVKPSYGVEVSTRCAYGGHEIIRRVQADGWRSNFIGILSNRGWKDDDYDDKKGLFCPICQETVAKARQEAKELAATK
jgi:hypothetical protein